MPSKATIGEFLRQEHIAVVGVSRDPKEFANSVYRTMRDHGYELYPVNPNAKEIEGDRAYAKVSDIPGPVDGVLIMVPPTPALQVIADCAARGVTRVWLHRGVGKGSSSPEAIDLCERYGIAVVDGVCPLMFLKPVKGVHRFHRMFRRGVAA